MWYKGLFQDQRKYRQVNGIWSKGDICGNDNMRIYDEQGGTCFHERSQIPGTHSFFDTQLLYHHLGHLFKKISPQVILDLGCGDGRATRWFLENTQANIIALDGVMNSLIRLQKQYLDGQNSFAQRVCLIHSNIDRLPIADEAVDFIWSFEVLGFLENDFIRGYKECVRVVKKNGMFVHADRDKDFGLLHELLMRGPQSMLDVADKQSKILEFCGNDMMSSAVKTRAEMMQIIKDHGLKCLETLNVPFYSFIVSYLKSQNQYTQEINLSAQKLSKAFISAAEYCGLNRSTIFVTQK
ncbi:MAG: class I SAM-dependent methyltransferase [Candidatus Omnitrophica bacterium]|nr:class I SAM-dependent methyltransferase [Candidatus Omnitrophota bacterium]